MIPSVTLKNGVRMPALGFGVFQIPEDDTERVVTDAVRAGYRLFDTASSYQNEAALGRLFATRWKPDSRARTSSSRRRRSWAK